VCGECKVLVDRFSSFYKTCSGYCASIGRQCTGAWEEQDDDCAVKYTMSCNETVASSDALCECGAEAVAGCYGEMPQLVVDEGSTVGESIDTSSAAECKAACDANAACQSFSLSPTWGCYMKDRSLSGGEDTKAHYDYQTYYKKPCGGTSPTATPSAAPTAGETCYGELAELAVDEGNEVGKMEISSAAECQRACDANPACRSFSLSPTWGCYLKDRSFSGGEATKAHYDYQTYYKKPCDGTASLEPTPSPTAAPSAVPTASPTASPAASPTAAPTAAPTAEEICYGELAELASDEGNEVGKVETSSAAECQQACDANLACQSFSLSSEWGCYLKDRTFLGCEATRSHYDFRTYYKKQCGSASCTPAPTPAPTPYPPGSAPITVTVMSWNTEFVGYPQVGGNRVPQYGAKIREVGAAVVGTQECLDMNFLARESGYTVATGTDRNPILYDPSKTSFVEGTGGWLSIPRDNYAERAVTWAQFRNGGVAWWFFNTHLPHPHGDAASSSTHARIANMVLDKRRDLGAADSPSAMVGDFNPFASSGSPVGSFESNFVAGGFFKAFEGRTALAGFDKIFASSAHWESANGVDHGRGASDHPAITADLTIRK
jgi:hypothetical protein